MNHTKGEWEVLRQGKEIQGSDEQCKVCGEYDGGQHEVSVIIKGIPVMICALDVEAYHSESNPMGADTQYHLTEKESLGNAYLMAAAPELLEACHKAYCKLVELEVDAEHSLFISEELDSLEQAILKTKGA